MGSIGNRLSQAMGMVKESVALPVIIELAVTADENTLQELSRTGLRITTTSRIAPLVYGMANTATINKLSKLNQVAIVSYDEPTSVMNFPLAAKFEHKEIVPVSEAVNAIGAEKVWDQGITGKDVKIAIIDSVPAHSPIIIKKNNIVDIIPISELDTFENHTIAEQGEEVAVCNDIQIFTRLSNPDSGKYWTDIKYVIRHKYNGKLLKINTQGGLIDVSPNHSLITAAGSYGSRDFGGPGGSRTIDASTVVIGTRLAMPGIIQGIEEKLFIGSEDLAWLYGFFVAEGSAPKYGSARKEVNIHNKNMDLLNKAKLIFETNFYGAGNKKGDEMTFYFQDDCNKICKGNKYIHDFFRDTFYTDDGNKRVPTSILNAPKNIKMCFLRGYNDGDGSSYDRLEWEFQNFTTISQTLAMGLVWLIKTTTGQEMNVHIRHDKLNVIHINLNKPDSKIKIKPRNSVKKIIEYDYDGYIYDVETIDHTFCSGIGPVKTHNTGSDLTHPMLKAGIKDSYSAVPGEDANDENSHGSWCASAAAGRPVESEYGPLYGVAPDADLYILKALSNDGQGQMSWVNDCIERAVIDFKCDVLSMSLGSLTDLAGLDPTSKLINEVTRKYNTLCVIASGNSFIPLSIGAPGGAASAITVGSVALKLPTRGLVSTFSSKGPTTGLLVKPDIAAYGGNLITNGISELIYAAGSFGEYVSMAGSSMSTPQVAGAMALLRQAKPDLSRLDVEQLFAESQFPHPKDVMTGYGSIRVDKMHDILFSPRLHLSELGMPLQVVQSVAAVPLSMVPREQSQEQLNVVRLPVIRAN